MKEKLFLEDMPENVKDEISLLFGLGVGIEELEYLGWDDLRDGLVLLEWPERVPQLQQQADLLVQLDYDGDGRMATLQGMSGKGEKMLELW